jgi:sugar phosphate isomerase/epimerase
MIPAFGLAPLGFLEVPPPDLIALAAAAGFASVSLRLRAAVPGGPAFPMRTGDDLMRACRRRIAETGIQVLAIEQVGLDRATSVPALRAMLEAGAELGATRLVCSGDAPDFAVVVDRFGELCLLAEEFNMAVDLEFMPFRAVKTLEDAVAVVAAAARKNGRVCLDALHLFRSGGRVGSLSAVDASCLGALQLSDAPPTPPPAAALAEEAREQRMLPGHGALPLAELLAAYPADRPYVAEIPLRRAFPHLDALGRARLIAGAMRQLMDTGRHRREESA